MRRLLTCLAVAAALGFPSSSAFAGSQVFTSTLTPESGVTTSGTATGVLLLNNTTDQVGGVVSYQDLTGTPTAVHLHGPGPGGEVTFEFTGIPSGATGLVASAFQLTTAQVADLQAGRDSFEIHTLSFPAGELSGLLTPGSAGYSLFTTTLIPESGVTTSGTATGVLLLNNTTDQVGAVVSYQDLTGTPTAVHLHGPAPGGEVTFEFTGIPSGATGLVASAFQLTTAQVADLQAGRDSFEIHTPSFPDGELSGTLTSSAVPEPSSVVLIGTGALFLVGYGCHCRARKTATARTT